MADSITQRLQELEQEKDDWMQKYFALLTERETEDLQVQEDLAVLEEAVNRLSLQVGGLQSEKLELETALESLRKEKGALELDLKSQQSRWEEDMASLRRVLAKERQACAKELETIGVQFHTVKKQFQELKAQTSAPQSKSLKRPASVRSLSSDKLRTTLGARGKTSTRGLDRL